MKSVNGGLLETLETDKYKIIIDDALKWLDKYKVEREEWSEIGGSGERWEKLERLQRWRDGRVGRDGNDLNN